MNTRVDVLLCVLSSILSAVLSAKVTAKGTSVTDIGKEASFSCALSVSDGVSQVTWQRLSKDNLVENLATYSKRFGAKVMDPFDGRIHFTEASLNSTSITIKKVISTDEACYICSFNVYPSGSIRKQTCLTVQGLYEDRAWRIPSNESLPEQVVVSCSATGKPAPDVQWSSSVEVNVVPKVQHVSQNDGAVTVTSTLTLILSEFLGRTVDCILSSPAAENKIIRTFILREAGTPEMKERSDFSSTLIIMIILVIVAAFTSIAYIVFRLKRKKGDKRATLPERKEA